MSAPTMSPSGLARLEGVVGTILRAGVLLSATAMIAGLVMLSIGYPGAARVLNGGLIVLMMIPSARILASLGDAIYRKDKLLAFATGYVTFVIIEEVIKKIFFK
jgi:uncharacterized membrane protein